MDGSKLMVLFLGHRIFNSNKYIRSFKQKLFKRIFHWENEASIHAHVHIGAHHKQKGRMQFSIGRRCVFNDYVNIDVTGALIVGNGVVFSEETLVYTHGHKVYSSPGEKIKSISPTSLTIDDGVVFGARAIILETCSHIGRFARIGAGAVVRNNIPPYAVVAGNPAKIVGFVFTPEEVKSFEAEHYADNPVDIRKYESNYQRYFINRIDKITEQLKN